MEDLLKQLLTSYGPWGLVGGIALVCIWRSNKREDRMAEVVRDSAVANQRLADLLQGQKK